MPAGPCRRPSRPPASHREAGEQLLRVPPLGRRARDHRAVLRLTVRERGAGPPRTRQTLNVPCQPDRRLADADRGPAARRARRSAATGGTARQNDRARRRPQPGPGQRQHRPAREPAGGPAERLLAGPAPAAGSGRSSTRQVSSASRRHRAATADRSNARAAARSAQRPAPPPARVGVADPERAAVPGAEQLARTARPAVRRSRTPVDRHPQQRRGHRAPAAPATRAA